MSGRRADRRRGDDVAALVSAAMGWRLEGPSTDVVLQLVPILVRSGTGPLAWQVARGRAEPERFRALRDSYLHQTLRRAIAETQLVRIAHRLDDAGVEWMTAKGWAVARRYRDPSTRPYGDVDVYVRPGQARRAREATRATGPADALGVDVHDGLSYLDDHDFDEIMTRVDRLPIGEATIPVMSRPDLTRLVALHALAEGVVRPVWLCDVGVLATGEWSRAEQHELFGGSSRRASYVGAAMSLARSILGAPVPDELTREPLRRWMAPSVLGAWGAGRRARGSRSWIRPGDMRGAQLAHVLTERWPTPFQATVSVQAPLGVVPRRLVEVADCARWYRAYRGRRIGE